ncbi:MAG: hypothetical protein WAU32_03020 [Thermoanaerobaculia bacterium]
MEAMTTRWYVFGQRFGQSRFEITIEEATERDEDPSPWEQSVQELEAIEDLLKALRPQRLARLLAGDDEEILRARPSMETVEMRIAGGLRALSSPEGWAGFVVIGPTRDQMAAIVSRWLSEWRNRRPGGDA